MKRHSGQFVKNDPRIGRRGKSQLAPGTTPTQIHRQQCRQLFEELKIRELFADATVGEEVDFYFDYKGKKKKVPANFRNRILAGIWLGEQGYGKAPGEITHRFDASTVGEFETALVRIFQKRIPKMCNHCGTHIEMPTELASEIMELSKLFERAVTENETVTSELDHSR